MKNIFLQAQWRNLILANYEFDPSDLKKYLPHKTELDFFNNRCLVSLVGFKFCDTKVMGFKIPFHTDFEEVNLRFYVRYKAPDLHWKRGVVFIKEIVPKPAITFVANTLYNENYATMPMRHLWKNGKMLEVAYAWKHQNFWNRLKVTAAPDPVSFAPDSEEEFITEHYWGYTQVKATTTAEYGVEHPQWRIHPVEKYDISVDCKAVYGEAFACLQNQVPNSVFLAEGSEIKVLKGNLI
jgi:uncharacterized protein YqjF (DUF2071 family)